MSGGAVVRSAVAGDAGTIAEVHVASYRAVYSGVMPEATLAAFTEQKRARVFTELLAAGSHRVDVLELDRILGFSVYGAPRDDDKDPAECCELQALYLAPSVWRSGHGSVLMQRVVGYARSTSLAQIVLWVLEENGSARSFYEAVGFAPDGQHKTIERGGWRANEMRYSSDLRKK